MKGIEIEWRGSGTHEVGVDNKTGRVLIEISSKYFRPAEVDILKGDSSKARNILEWYPNYTFEDLIKEMVKADC
jgi:GDPmannose 4,6-dehydratase